jgi:hypothetical protein
MIETIAKTRQTLVLGIMVAVFLLLSGCGQTPTQVSLSASADTIPPDTLISLQRTGCHGVCPIYTVTIMADGTVTFIGEANVKEAGLSQSSISEEGLRTLIGEFEKINFFGYEDDYGFENKDCEFLFMDAPSAITTFTSQGKTKQIKHYYGCEGFSGEAELTTLETMIDEVANTAQWVEEN